MRHTCQCLYSNTLDCIFHLNKGKSEIRRCVFHSRAERRVRRCELGARGVLACGREFPPLPLLASPKARRTFVVLATVFYSFITFIYVSVTPSTKRPPLEEQAMRTAAAPSPAATVRAARGGAGGGAAGWPRAPAGPSGALGPPQPARGLPALPSPSSRRNRPNPAALRLQDEPRTPGPRHLPVLTQAHTAIVSIGGPHSCPPQLYPVKARICPEALK